MTLRDPIALVIFYSVYRVDWKQGAEFVQRRDFTNEIPKPVDRVRSELTPQERLAIYDHVLQVMYLHTSVNISCLFVDQKQATCYIAVKE